jgi:hypothetical protein
MPKFNFGAMENRQNERFSEFGKILKERSKRENAKINEEVGKAKEEIIRAAAMMDKARSVGNRNKSRMYLDIALDKLSFMETQISAKAMRRTLHTMGWNGPRRRLV